MSDRIERRLTVIVSADVVGYSRLIRADEAGTRTAFNGHRRELIDPKLSEQHGRLVGIAGDSLLAEFASVVDAVEWAVEVQRGMAERNANVPEDRRVLFRIGVNSGDVIIEGADIHGDGVNVAARLQSLSEPGGICVAAYVFEQVRHRLNLGFEDLGEQQVKNIADPVRAYRVLLAPEAAGTLIAAKPASPRKRRRRLMPAGAAVVVVAAIAVALIWWQFSGGPTSVQGEPVVAVLPFDNLSGDPANERLADGITEDIITDLSRYREFAVIARNSTAVYKGKPTDVRQIGKDLNVSHVLEGSFQREAGQIRVAVQLIDSATGKHIWSERYDRPAGEVFAIQSEVVDRIANSLGGYTGHVEGSLLKAAKRKQPADLSAYELYLLAEDRVLGGLDLDSQKEATKLLEQVIQMDPGLARAHQELAWNYSLRALLEPDFPGFMQKMLAEARLAVDLDPADSQAQMALGFALTFTGNPKQGEIHMNEARRLNPNFFDILSGHGCFAVMFGKAQAGVESVERAIRLNPNFPAYNVPCMRFAFAVVGRYEDVLRVQEHEPEEKMHAFGYPIVAGSLAKLGRLDEAKALAARGVAKFPGMLTLEQLVWGSAPILRPIWYDLMRAADFPVCADDKDVARYPNAVRLPECVKQTH